MQDRVPFSLELSFPPLLTWENHRIQGLDFKSCLSHQIFDPHQICKPLSLW